MRFGFHQDKAVNAIKCASNKDFTVFKESSKGLVCQWNEGKNKCVVADEYTYQKQKHYSIFKQSSSKHRSLFSFSKRCKHRFPGSKIRTF